MYIQSLALGDIKAFKKLSLDFKRSTPGADEYAGLTVLVGGNSSGKSTLLKSIAMAASGPTTANQQLISPVGWIRHGATKGQIDLHIIKEEKDKFREGGRSPSAESFSAALVFEAENGGLPTLRALHRRTPKRTRIITADRGPWNPDASGWFVGGYGPLRRLTGSSTEALRYTLGQGKLASCVTLFREDAALSESETWLKQEHARALEQKDQGKDASELVERVREFLNDGLMPQGFRVTRVTVDQVFMETPNGGELPMRDLSDGCRSAYALMLDIIHNMAITYKRTNLFSEGSNGYTVVDHPGVILIDELEAHLHPSWQQTICVWLRTRFPKVQFFITTHSPLIAQAADPDGIFVLPLPDEIAAGQTVRKLKPYEQERVALGRAEKVLLGQAFGLKYTWSIQAEKLVQKWEELSALREAGGNFNGHERSEYDRLTQQVSLVFDDDPEEALRAVIR